MWLQRKMSLLGHIIRSEPNDRMRQVLFGTSKNPASNFVWASRKTSATVVINNNMRMPINHIHLTWTTLRIQLVNELALQGMGVFS